MTFFMRQKEGNVFFKICHFLITGRVVLHNKFYKKISSTSYQKWENYLGKKTSFWWLDLLFSGWKKMKFSGEKKWTFFRLISIEKVKNYLLIQKIILWHFHATKRRERFFKICHFLITGRVVLHKKFYKKISSTSYQKWKKISFRQKNFFLVAGFIILGVKKNEHFFDWFQSKKWRIIF